MEQLASQLSRDVSERNNEIIRLTLENERLREQLNARNEAGSQATGREASSSGLDQHQPGDDCDEACEVTSPCNKANDSAGQTRTLRRGHKRKHAPESESDDSEYLPIKAEGKNSTAANKNAEKERRPGRLPSGVLKRKHTFETSRPSQSLEESTAPKKAKPGPQANPKAETPKRRRLQDASIVTPPSKKSRPPPAFKPLSKRPLPLPDWQTPPAKPSTTFHLPITKNLDPSPPSGKKQAAPTTTSKPYTEPAASPRYAETHPSLSSSSLLTPRSSSKQPTPTPPSNTTSPPTWQAI